VRGRCKNRTATILYFFYKALYTEGEESACTKKEVAKSIFVLIMVLLVSLLLSLSLLVLLSRDNRIFSARTATVDCII
jgi:hypothetical protein